MIAALKTRLVNVVIKVISSLKRGAWSKGFPNMIIFCVVNVVDPQEGCRNPLIQIIFPKQLCERLLCGQCS